MYVCCAHVFTHVPWHIYGGQSGQPVGIRLNSVYQTLVVSILTCWAISSTLPSFLMLFSPGQPPINYVAKMNLNSCFHLYSAEIAWFTGVYH